MISKKAGVYAGLVALLVSILPAYAQDTSPPTDIDLRASYCMAVIQKEQALIKSTFPNIDAAPADIPQPVRNNWLAQKDRLNHLSLYLLPRMKYVDPTGLLAARTRGLSDLDRLQSPAMMTCAEHCTETMLKGTLEQSTACLRSCDPETLPRVWACNDLSWLPF